MNLELGGGTLAPPGWVNLDPVHGSEGWKRYAEDVPWPAVDGSVDSILASHVMEHIPAGSTRINVMNQAHRVLRPGGVFTIRVPNCLSGTWHAFADPTHVSFWCIESFHYLDGVFAANADYGISPWTTLELVHQGDQEIMWRGQPR